MKKKIKVIVVFIAMVIIPKLYSQSTIAGPVGNVRPGPAAFLGWDGTGPNPGQLQIRNDFNFPITFSTAGTVRMTIRGQVGPTQGYVGIATANPLFPLTVRGDGANNVTTAGWKAGILLQNHAVLAWQAPGANSLFMGHPSFNPDESFYCGLATGLGNTAVPDYIYRIVDLPAPGTPPNSGDFEFFGGTTNHNVLVDTRLGVGAAPLNYNPQNRIHITTALGDPYFGNPAGSSGLRFTNMIASTNTIANPGSGVLSVDANGDVIYVPGSVNANNGTSISTINPNTVVLGNNIASTTAQLISDREIPLNAHNLIFSGTPDAFPGKVGFGIVGGINNPAPLALRATPVTMQVNGSISLFDGTGNTSLFFGEEQFAYNSGTLGEWGIQYEAASATGPGLNFWRPFGSTGFGFGNNFLFLSDNGNIAMGATAAAAPGNALTITSYPASPQPAGLRFTNLTSASSTIPNVGTMGVLAVDVNGDVIYVPASPFTFGGACGNTNAMSSDFEIPMGTSNFIFSGQGVNVTNFGIGMPVGGCVPSAKLEVHQSSANPLGSTAVRITNNDVLGQGVDLSVTGGGANHVGFNSLVTGATGNNNGFVSTAFGGTQTRAGVFKGQVGSAFNYGVDADASGGTAINYAGNFTANATTTGDNYALKAMATNASGQNFALYADGDIFINSASTSTTGFVNGTSDAMFKTNVDTLTDALHSIMLLTPKTFYFDTANSYNMHFDSHQHYGFIAQDVQTVIPSIVGSSTKPAELDSLGNIVIPSVTYHTLSYIDLIAVLTKGMQEQQHKMDSLTQAVISMQSQMNSCCSMNARTQNSNTTNQTDVTLTNSESVVLNQNVPNPFAEQTTIAYNLPESVQKAQLLFYNATGQLIKSVDLNGRGKGQINVFANDLSNGIYSYALVVDGQIADTKRMVKTN